MFLLGLLVFNRFYYRGILQVTLAHAYEANQRIVDQLNDQVDFLNTQLANREVQLSEVSLKRRYSLLDVEIH